MKVHHLFAAGRLTEAAGRTAADELAAALTKGFSHPVTLPPGLVAKLNGLHAKGQARDLGECVYDHDTLGTTTPEHSYFEVDPKDAKESLQFRELPGVAKWGRYTTKEGVIVHLFKHKTLPVLYTVDSDGESGVWTTLRLELDEPTA